MPTKRIYGLILATGILLKPALGVARLWAARTLVSQPEKSFLYHAAEVVVILS